MISTCDCRNACYILDRMVEMGFSTDGGMVMLQSVFKEAFVVSVVFGSCVDPGSSLSRGFLYTEWINRFRNIPVTDIIQSVNFFCPHRATTRRVSSRAGWHPLWAGCPRGWPLSLSCLSQRSCPPPSSLAGCPISSLTWRQRQRRVLNYGLVLGQRWRMTKSKIWIRH